MDNPKKSQQLFSPPPLPRVLVNRLDILWLLQDIEYVKLCAIIAPAGYGKTTSASLFANRNKKIYRFIWLSLQLFDEDFYTFLRKFSFALSSLSPEFEDTFWIKYDNLNLKKDPSEKHIHQFGYIIGEWLNDLLTEELIIVFDDYQYVNPSKFIKSFISGFIDGSPQHLKLMFTSRTGLNLNTMKYLASQSYLEVSKDDLKFTEPEIKELLNLNLTQPSQENIPDSFIHQLHELTGGWAASLILAISRLRKSKIQTEVSLDFQTKETINKYLSEQVFQDLASEIQLFMLAISVISEFSKTLAKKLFFEIKKYKEELLFLSPISKGNIETDDIIKELTSAQLITSSENQTSNYYTHQLLRDFLIAKLPEHIKVVLYKTCGNYYEHKNPILSLEFNVLGKNPKKCISLLWHMLEGNITVSLTRLKTKIFEVKKLTSEIEDQKTLLFLSVKIEHLLGHISLSEQLLNELQNSYTITKNSLLFYNIKLLTIENLSSKHDFEKTKEFSHQLISELKKTKIKNTQTLLVKTLMHYAFSLSQLSNDFEGIKISLDILNEAWSISKETNDKHLLDQLLRFNFFIALEYDVEEVNKRFEVRYEQVKSSNPKVRIDLLKDFAFMQISVGNFHEATQKINEGLALAENYTYESAIATLNFLLAECELAKGDFQNAHEHYSIAANYFFSVSASNTLVIYMMQQINAFYSGLKHNIIDRSQEVFHFIEEPTIRNLVHFKTAQLFYALSNDNYHEALDVVLSIIKEFQEVNRYTVTLLSELYLFKAYILMRGQLGNFPKAVSEFLQLIKNIPKVQAETALKRYWRIGEQVMTHAQTVQSKLKNHAHEIEKALELIIKQKRDLGLFQPAKQQNEKEPIQGFDPKTLLHIQTFGEFKLWRVKPEDSSGYSLNNITEKNFPNTASIQAFKILLIHHHEPVNTDTLIEYIWPNSVSEYHPKMLQNAISAIRKTLYNNGLVERNTQFIIKSEYGYRLNLGTHGVDYFCDMEEFNLLIKQASLADSQNSFIYTSKLYQQAVDLYLGDFLEADRFEIWSAYTQESLKDQYLQALIYLAEYHYQKHHLAKTEAFCNKILDIDPIAETAYELLIKICRERKLLSKAHKVFKRCKKAFRKELNTFPPLHIERMVKHF